MKRLLVTVASVALVLLALAGPVSAQGAVEVEPVDGAPPGAQVTVVGSGFAPGESVTVVFLGQVYGPVFAGDDGAFTLEFTLPADAAQGTHPLDALGDQGTAADTDYAVTPATEPPTSTSTTAASGAPGSTSPPLGPDGQPSASVTPTSGGPTTTSAASTTGGDPTTSAPADDDEQTDWIPWVVLVVLVLLVLAGGAILASSRARNPAPPPGPPPRADGIAEVPRYIAPAPPPAGCRIEVKATKIGALDPLPVYHLLIVFTDAAGNQTFYRGGPGGPGGSPPHGTIQTTIGPYVPGSIDYEVDSPSVIVIEGPEACAKAATFAAECARIDALRMPYVAHGPQQQHHGLATPQRRRHHPGQARLRRSRLGRSRARPTTEHRTGSFWRWWQRR